MRIATIKDEQAPKKSRVLLFFCQFNHIIDIEQSRSPGVQVGRVWYHLEITEMTSCRITHCFGNGPDIQIILQSIKRLVMGLGPVGHLKVWRQDTELSSLRGRRGFCTGA